ncbi:hypothetical protein [Levilactobacillus enshiensis]|uniref:hypothetical protein n=1 Tax=Levilactobacillus enshiensis TaxID=2590213 RepID=UPI00117A0E27|nr:hypothetical protein [Levilactobacillus enshiensis]
MNQRELADRLNTTEKKISELVNGNILLDDELIDGLSLALGTSTTLWKNLNEKYLTTKRQVEQEQQLEQERVIQQQIDYRFWRQLGLVKETRNIDEKILALKRFLHISNLEVLEKRDFLVQYKTAVAEVKTINVINSNAWVQTALNLGNREVVEDIDLNYLKSVLPEIKAMTLESPTEFIPKLRVIFRKAGVAFVMMPNLKNCGINGAVKWLGKEKVLLALNDRRKYADVFWFALFHEIRHIFQQKKGHIIVSTDKNIGIESPLNLDELEQDADDFSRDFLIPPTAYKTFVQTFDFSKTAVEAFAQEIHVHPGIVVGRLQRDQFVKFSQLNQLRLKFKVPVEQPQVQ